MSLASAAMGTPTPTSAYLLAMMSEAAKYFWFALVLGVMVWALGLAFSAQMPLVLVLLAVVSIFPINTMVVLALTGIALAFAIATDEPEKEEWRAVATLLLVVFAWSLLATGLGTLFGIFNTVFSGPVALGINDNRQMFNGGSVSALIPGFLAGAGAIAAFINAVFMAIPAVRIALPLLGKRL
jgi:hypothetical protein